MKMATDDRERGEAFKITTARSAKNSPIKTHPSRIKIKSEILRREKRLGLTHPQKNQSNH